MEILNLLLVFILPSYSVIITSLTDYLFVDFLQLGIVVLIFILIGVTVFIIFSVLWYFSFAVVIFLMRYVVLLVLLFIGSLAWNYLSTKISLDYIDCNVQVLTGYFALQQSLIIITRQLFFNTCIITLYTVMLLFSVWLQQVVIRFSHYSMVLHNCNIIICWLMRAYWCYCYVNIFLAFGLWQPLLLFVFLSELQMILYFYYSSLTRLV